MEQEKSVRLLLRQLKDIQAQAEKIVTGENSSETIETFARYSIELKSYIVRNVDSEEIRSFIHEVPEINYSKRKIKLWQYLILPSWWIGLYIDYHAKKKTIEEIHFVKGKYATLEVLIKSLAT